MSTTPTQSGATTPSKLKKPAKCDSREDLPDPYITFNPGMLDDEKWSFRDLQRLAGKLGLGSKGTREQLIQRLREWHKRQFNSNRRCAGSNFSLLEVELPPSPKDEQGNPTRGGISPKLLSPLRTRPQFNPDGTPKSILKKQNTSSAKKTLTFSIFNGTKIIPPRDEIRRQWAYEDGIDPDASYSSSSDEEVEEETNFMNNLNSAFTDALADEVDGVAAAVPQSSGVSEEFADISVPVATTPAAVVVSTAVSSQVETDEERIARLEREWLSQSPERTASSAAAIAIPSPSPSVAALPRVSASTASQVLRSMTPTRSAFVAASPFVSIDAANQFEPISADPSGENNSENIEPAPSPTTIASTRVSAEKVEKVEKPQPTVGYRRSARQAAKALDMEEIEQGMRQLQIQQ